MDICSQSRGVTDGLCMGALHLLDARPTTAAYVDLVGFHPLWWWGSRDGSNWDNHGFGCCAPRETVSRFETAFSIAVD